MKWLLLWPFLLLSPMGWAFNEDAHKVIAQISLAYLTPKSHERLESWFGEDYRQELIDGSVYVIHKEKLPANKWMKPLHFTLYDKDEAFDHEKHCPKNQCSIGAVLESRYILTRSQYSLIQKKQALRYLTHFIADLHMPMNNAFTVDQGGRLVKMTTPEMTTVSLSWVWNTGLYKQKEGKWFAIANEYRSEIKREHIEQWNMVDDPVAWSKESHDIAASVAYTLAKEKLFNSSYIKDAMPVYDEQVKKAGIRLAHYLNKLFE